MNSNSKMVGSLVWNKVNCSISHPIKEIARLMTEK